MSDRTTPLVIPSAQNQANVGPKTPRWMYRIGNALIQLDKIMWTKRYRPLQMDVESLSSETAAKMGVGICSLDCQLAFEHALRPDEQVAILESLNKELASAGMLTNFYVLPDSTIIRPSIIDRADYGPVKLGWVVSFYLPGRDKSILSCLLANEPECLDLLQSLAARVNSIH